MSLSFNPSYIYRAAVTRDKREFHPLVWNLLSLFPGSLQTGWEVEKWWATQIKLNSGVMCSASVGDLSCFGCCIFPGSFSWNKMELQHHLLRARVLPESHKSRVIKETPNHCQGLPSPRSRAQAGDIPPLEYSLCCQTPSPRDETDLWDGKSLEDTK